MSFFPYTSIHRAYTELFAGLSLEVSPDKTGAWSTSSIHLPLKLVADCVDFSRDAGAGSVLSGRILRALEEEEGRRQWTWGGLLGVEREAGLIVRYEVAFCG